MSEPEVEAYIEGKFQCFRKEFFRVQLIIGFIGVRTMEFDRYLGAYSYDTYTKWQELISFVSPKVLEKLEPVGHKIDSTSKPMTKEEEEKYRKEFNMPSDENSSMNNLINNINKIVPVHQPYYSTIPNKKALSNNQNIDPRLITKYNIDKSFVLDEMIDKEYNGDPNMMLGELQFAFVTFLIGQSFESFEAWKNLVSILCQCDEALTKHAILFVNFTKVFQAQLMDVPDDFFIDEISGGKNFIREMLKVSFSMLNNQLISILFLTNRTIGILRANGRRKYQYKA